MTLSATERQIPECLQALCHPLPRSHPTPSLQSLQGRHASLRHTFLMQMPTECRRPSPRNRMHIGLLLQLRLSHQPHIPSKHVRHIPQKSLIISRGSQHTTPHPGIPQRQQGQITGHQASRGRGYVVFATMSQGHISIGIEYIKFHTSANIRRKQQTSKYFLPTRLCN